MVTSLIVLEAVCSALNLYSVCQVSLEFSPTSAVPGEEVNLKLKALPNSLCGVSAIDQSVLVLEPGETMTTEMVNARTKFNQDIQYSLRLLEKPSPTS